MRSMRGMHLPPGWVVVGTVLLALAGVWLLPLVDSSGVIISNEVRTVLYHWRLQRAVLASCAGGGLAIAGLAFQTLFRNALATPYTLGVASGGSLGATIALFAGGATIAFAGLSAVSWGALGGAMLAMLLVDGIARLRRASPEQMLLAGVAVNLFFASLVLVIQYLADPSSALRIIRWTIGGIDSPWWSDVACLAPPVILYAAALWLLSRELNIITTGSDRATTLGVPVAGLYALLFFGTSVVVGLIVSFCGPIGFVGLMVPHLMRLVVGPDHRHLVPATLFFGAFFLALCDTVARSLIPACELPVGAITSLLGGPFFLWLLLSKHSKHAT